MNIYIHYMSASYKELCAEVYSITRVKHKDGPVPKAPRGYSPDWWLTGKLDRRAENMFYAKQGAPDFKADEKGTHINHRVQPHF